MAIREEQRKKYSLLKKRVTHTFSFASYRSRQGLMIQFIKVYLFRKTIALCNSNNNTHECEMFSIILCD